MSLTVPLTSSPRPPPLHKIPGAPRKHPRDDDALSRCLTQIEEEGEEDHSPVNKRLRFHGPPRVFTFEGISSTLVTQSQENSHRAHQPIPLFDAIELKLPSVLPHQHVSRPLPPPSSSSSHVEPRNQEIDQNNMTGCQVSPWWKNYDLSSDRRKNLASRSNRSLPVPRFDIVGGNKRAYVVNFTSDTTHLSFLFNIYNWPELRTKGSQTYDLYINDSSCVYRDECIWRLEFLASMAYQCPWIRIKRIIYNGNTINTTFRASAEIMYKASPFSLWPIFKYGNGRRSFTRIDNIILSERFPEADLVPDEQEWVKLRVLYIMDYIRQARPDEPILHLIITNHYSKDYSNIIFDIISENTHLLPPETRTIEIYDYTLRTSRLISTIVACREPDADLFEQFKF